MSYRVNSVSPSSHFNISRASHLDFEDDRNYFSMYLYKNRLPISQLMKYGKSFISIRPDYLLKDTNLSEIEWLEGAPEESRLCYDKYNPCRSFDMYEFCRDCDRVLEKLDKLNEELSVIDEEKYAESIKALEANVKLREEAINRVKSQFNVWVASESDIKSVKEYMDYVMRDLNEDKEILANPNALSIRQKKQQIRRKFNGLSYYFECLNRCLEHNLKLQHA